MTYERHPSGESSPLALILHRLAAIEAGQKEAKDTNAAQGTLLYNIDKNLALGNQRMNEIDAHLEATDQRVTTIEDDRRVAFGLWASIGGLLSGAAAIISTLFSTGHKP